MYYSSICISLSHSQIGGDKIWSGLLLDALSRIVQIQGITGWSGTSGGVIRAPLGFTQTHTHNVGDRVNCEELFSGAYPLPLGDAAPLPFSRLIKYFYETLTERGQGPQHLEKRCAFLLPAEGVDVFSLVNRLHGRRY